MTTLAQSNLTERLQVSEREWLLVSEILSSQIPGHTVWAFGSRATGLHVKRFSDLDLAIAGRLTSRERAALNDAFDEALINFKVDVVELDLLEAAFRQRIERDFVLLQASSSVEDGAYKSLL
jgi:predicted nucleotidyltransferase